MKHLITTLFIGLGVLLLQPQLIASPQNQSFMCNLVEKLDRDVFIGYKVAVKHTKKDQVSYLSPATALEYKVGEVPIVDEINADRIGGLYVFYHNIVKRGSILYKSRLVGRTSVFVNPFSAVQLELSLKRGSEYMASMTKQYPSNWYEMGYDFKILKMTIAQDLLGGTYERYGKVVAGRSILAFGEI